MQFIAQPLKIIAGWFLILAISASAQELASGSPGKDAKWESAGKQGIGTASSRESKVWFTLQGGSLTEVFYPTVDNANAQWLQFVVVDPKTKKVETEREDSIHRIITLDPQSLTFQQINRSKSGVWEIRKTYTTDPERNSILIDVEFLPRVKGLDLYVYYNPSLKNSGMKDAAWSQDGGFFTNEADAYCALSISTSFAEMNNGFYGTSDGIEQLKETGKLGKVFTKAEDGNVAQLGRIRNPARFTIGLSFGTGPQQVFRAVKASLNKGFSACLAEYQNGWQEYTKTLPRIWPKFQKQFNYAAMVLRASEDKTFYGGNVASLSKPWIPGSDANGPYVGGYHLVWSRDLYQVATAYIALGDKHSANRALSYLFKYQQKPDGSYPQISWLDGRALGDAVQMDEVSYPLILAYQLGRNDSVTFRKHIKPTADYIAKNGPRTGQERWEEKPGYSPSTIAAEIAGLICAADIAEKNGDKESAKRWQEKADEWTMNVEKWTATATGKYRDGNYYLRLTKNGTPDAGEKIELNNGAGTWLENEIVDAGFLELVRLGIKSPDDPLIVKSLKVTDDILKVKTPNGDGFFRYTHDGYGEYYDGRNWNYDRTWTGKGHLWPILTGERGQYEIADCGSRKANLKLRCLTGARHWLNSMLGFANDGMMIPEQVWDKPNGLFAFGEGAGSATPLAWSMAQFIRLAMNLKAGRNLDTPEVVARRYGNLR